MKTGSHVSCIVPSHQHRRFLPKRFVSIQGQSVRPEELIVIDDGSTDGSAQWLSAWQSSIPLRLETRPTASGNPFSVWNDAAAQARGDWLWFAESDDACEPTFLATLLAAAHAHPEAAIVFCQSELVNANGTRTGTFADFTQAYDTETWRTDFVMDGREAVERLLLPRNTIPNVSACLISHRAWRAAGGADASLTLCGDWLTYARLLEHGSLVFCARPLNRHRHHRASQRARIDQFEYLRQSYIARQINADRHRVPDSLREFARRYAWIEARGLLHLDAATFAGRLPEAVQAAAIAFDPRFVQRGEDRRLQMWDTCDAFCDPAGGFAVSNQRRIPVLKYNEWSSVVFRHCAGQLRIDPFSRPGQCRLRKLALVDASSDREVWRADATTGFAGITANAGVNLSRADDALVIESLHDDPQLLLAGIGEISVKTFDVVAEFKYPLE